MSKRSIASYFKPIDSNKKPKTVTADVLPDGNELGPAAPEAGAKLSPQPGKISTSSVHTVSNPHQPRPAEHPPPSQPLQDSKALSELAARNHDIVVQRVAAARSQGPPPPVHQLLVEESWLEALRPQFKMPYWPTLESFVASEWKSAGSSIYPPVDCVFRAYNSCPLQSVRVVILGQDPYHNPGQAVGLSFSVPRGVPVPSSLQNMYKELQADCGCQRPKHGDLTKWADQGVFLLNATLTVRARTPGSHQKKGWEQFTDATIRTLSEQRKGLVFLLWGNWAKQKAALINTSKHHVLTAAHPSGLSANKGFFGCRHFSKANKLLQAAGMPPIDWQIE